MSIHKELKEAENNNDFDKCIELYRKAIKSPDLFQSNELFDIKYNLANLLTKNSNNIEEAIGIFSNLLEKTLQTQDSEKWAFLNLGLGFAYDQRIEGNRNENLKNVLTYYEKALRYFEKDKYPEKWASTTAGIGLAYSEIENGDNKNNIIKAIECYIDTLSVYTKDKYPDDYEDSLLELGRLKKRLNDDKQWNELMDKIKG